MAEPSVGKQEGEITAVQHNSIDGGRRASFTDVDLNKNLDAKYISLTKNLESF
jgi:hypothetical protein